ncbi:hypothetical protein [Microbacterium sp. KNMS]
MNDYLPPEFALPIATVLWLVVLVPVLARWNRARRRARKAAAAWRPDPFEVDPGIAWFVITEDMTREDAQRAHDEAVERARDRVAFSEAVLSDIRSLPEATAWEHPA